MLLGFKFTMCALMINRCFSVVIMSIVASALTFSPRPRQRLNCEKNCDTAQGVNHEYSGPSW